MQIASVQDPLNHSTTYGYTGGCLTSVQDPRGTTFTLACNAFGETKSIKDSSNNKWTFGYPQGDLMKITDALSPARVWNVLVDNAGNRVALTNAYGERSLLSYDQLDGLTQHVDPRGRIVSYTYDANENLLSASVPATNTPYTYAYNSSDSGSCRPARGRRRPDQR